MANPNKPLEFFKYFCISGGNLENNISAGNAGLSVFMIYLLQFDKIVITIDFKTLFGSGKNKTNLIKEHLKKLFNSNKYV